MCTIQPRVQWAQFVAYDVLQINRGTRGAILIWHRVDVM
jgi:hypothetical protein